jgi:hypothetical protein
MKKIVLIMLFCWVGLMPSYASYLLIPMDDAQKNHLKAYGVAFWALQREVEVTWLLNYRGGSFMMKYADVLERECRLRGVTAEAIADGQSSAILSQIADPGVNMDAVRLQKAPKVAVYSPKNKLPWDDAVTLVLTYAEIPYDVVYDEEVMAGVLPPMTGCICTMRTSRGSMANSGPTIVISNGTLRTFALRSLWPTSWVLAKLVSSSWLWPTRYATL